VKPSSFAGREPQLAQLDTHISSEGGRRLAIYGLGGCGKTVLALEAAYRTRDQQPARAVLWVPAVNRESFEEAYREIGNRLSIPGIADDNAHVKQLLKAWLSNEKFGQWLMVVDNADDNSVLFGALGETSSADRLFDWLPYSRKGSIVFTTRTREAAIKLAESNVVPLGKLTKAEAEEVLETRLLQEHRHQLQSGKTIDEFLEMLEFLALAIVQAVAYMNAKGVTVAKYISLFKSSEKVATELLSKEFEDQGRYRDTKNPVATTWYISFEQIRKHDELAARHLSFMACIASSNIPASLLPPANSDLAQTEAIGTLKAYAFIIERQSQDVGKDGNQMQAVPFEAFDLHPLVHRATRGWLKAQDQWHEWANTALTRLVQVVPYGDNESREAWIGYLPHAMHVAGLPELYQAQARMSLLDRTGLCEQTLGRFRAAELIQRKQFEQKTEVLGKKNPSTLMSMSNLALVLESQGKYKEAEAVNRQTLALSETVLGREHPDTLTSMSNLAGVLESQGKYKEAEAMNRQTLALKETVVGREHPDTLTSMSNLAQVLGRQGKYKEAEAMNRQTLALSETVLGREHPETLTSMSNLAQVLGSRGKYEEAEAMNRQTLALFETVLGREHPSTLTSMSNLAQVLGSRGKYEEAEAMNRQTLALKETVVGREHPST
jgi:tetratricopeptide (TPR) repeat protein